MGDDSDSDGENDRKWRARQSDPQGPQAAPSSSGAPVPGADKFAHLRDLPAIFWDQDDIDQATRMGCPPADLVGLQSVLYDDKTPEELAESMKARGGGFPRETSGERADAVSLGSRVNILFSQ